MRNPVLLVVRRKWSSSCSRVHGEPTRQKRISPGRQAMTLDALAHAAASRACSCWRRPQSARRSSTTRSLQICATSDVNSCQTLEEFPLVTVAKGSIEPHLSWLPVYGVQTLWTCTHLPMTGHSITAYAKWLLAVSTDRYLGAFDLFGASVGPAQASNRDTSHPARPR